MSRRSIAIPVVAALVLLFAAAAANANMIAYSTWSANQIRVMVMDDSGANPTEVYRYGKFSIGGEFTISPPGSDGTWVAIEDYDLWKVRADGTDLVTILCFQGKDINGNPYTLFGNPQWSPDGSEILVQTGHSLALIPADHEVDYSECETGVVPTELVPFHCYDWGEPCVPASYWNLEGSAAWNDDGSKIAFFENLYDPHTDQFIAIQLVILGRQNNVWARLVEHELDPNPVESDISFLLQLDWQRDGSVLAFVSREETGRRVNFWLTWIDAATGVWDFFTEDGSRIEGGGPSWSPDGSQLIFTDSGGRLVKKTYPDGPSEVMGSGDDADWQRNPLPITCGSDLECDDGNPCTDNVCEGGVCVTYDHTDSCDDGNPCTFPDFCDGGSCSGEPILAGPAGGCDGWCCDGECWGGAGSCESEPVDCSLLFEKKACNAEPACRWDNRNKVCVPV